MVGDRARTIRAQYNITIPKLNKLIGVKLSHVTITKRFPHENTFFEELKHTKAHGC